MPSFWPLRSSSRASYQLIPPLKCRKSSSDTSWSSDSDPPSPHQRHYLGHRDQTLFFTISFWLLLVSSAGLRLALKWTMALTGIPANAGFVHIPQSQAYSLRPNKDVVPGTKNVYMLSAYHQLHCLKKLHLAFIDLRISCKPKASFLNLKSQFKFTTCSRAERGHGPLQKRSERMAKEVMDLKHAEHCFAYLRQGIMCAGDTTLEEPDPERRGTLQGWGVVHQCRMWDGEEGLEEWRKRHGVV